jgi:glutamyl-tRNA(Gln) amidotransferase subunit D
MLPETAYIKLGWVLGQVKDYEKVKELMLKNIKNEFSERLTPDMFLY